MTCPSIAHGRASAHGVRHSRQCHRCELDGAATASALSASVTKATFRSRAIQLLSNALGSETTAMVPFTFAMIGDAALT